MRRVLALLAVLAASLGLATGVPAAARADNGAIAVNTKDGSSVFKFAFKIKHVMGDVVDETNAAVSYASCTDCSTTAIAIEIVLVEGSPSTFAPTNMAIAVNYQCNLCNTFAAAYQFVIQTNGPVHFTSDGRKELAAIRKEIRSLEREHLTPEDLAARLKPLIDRLKAVLATQLVQGPPKDEDGSNNQDQSNAGENVPNKGTRTVTTGPAATATAPADTGTTGTTATTTTEPTTTGVTGTTTTP